MIRSIVTGLVIALLITSCVVRHYINGPRLTGTCDGACAHYLECKASHSEADGARCHRECPAVLSDADSLMAYESMTCENAVEFVDGTQAQAAATSR